MYCVRLVCLSNTDVFEEKTNYFKCDIKYAKHFDNLKLHLAKKAAGMQLYNTLDLDFQ